MKWLLKLKFQAQLNFNDGLYLLLVIILTTGPSCQQKTAGAEHLSPTKITTDSLAPSAGKTLNIAYIGNMGVLLESDTQTVIIDGLHEYYKADYAYPTPSTIEQLVNGQYPGFSAIEAALVTHHHGDHYSANYAYRFLSQNPSALLFGAAQVADDLRQLEDYKRIPDQQLVLVDYDQQIHETQHAGISIKAIQCPHVNPARHGSIQNIAYLVNINGYTILHLGDTHWEQAESAFQSLALGQMELDVAVLPYWMLLDETAKQWVTEKIAPRQLIATHIPPGISKSEQEPLTQNYPGITIFVELGEMVKLD